MHYPPTQIAESGVKNFFSVTAAMTAAVTLHPKFAPQVVGKRPFYPRRRLGSASKIFPSGDAAPNFAP